MRFSASIFLNILLHATDATPCETDTWVNCVKYRKCVMPPEQESFQRTVFCTAGNVPYALDGEISCVAKATLPCDATCADGCNETEEQPQPVPDECMENSVSPISCTKYHLCLGGKQRTVHCNAGLVHDGVSTECAEVSTLPPGHNCGSPAPTLPPRDCEESAVEAVSCTTYRMCIGGVKRLVHCNAGLVHDGVSTGCVPKHSVPACGPQPSCITGTVEASSCTGFRLCTKGAMHTVKCNAGLFHDGVSAKCFPPSELPCGSACGPACSCTAGHVIPIDCSHFRVCVGGDYKFSQCQAGLVHDGVSANCVAPSELPCNSACGLECSCSAGHVIPIDCTHFRVCVGGVYKLSTCNDGLVHAGPEALCLPQSAVPCGSVCGVACPVVNPVTECAEGSASPVSCKKFKFCVDGQWKMSYCKHGLVHAGGYEAVCVSPTSLECGSHCAEPCPPQCEDGAFIPLDCDHFRYCYNGEWKTSMCHEGLVNLGYEAQCVPQAGLECGSQCAIECPTPVTDCEPGQVDDSYCGGYAVCNDDGFWDETECDEGCVHVAGAGCIDQAILNCDHECGPECPPPVPCNVCPITECPACPQLIEYKCPCEDMYGNMRRLGDDIKMIFEYQMDQISCEA